MPSPEQVCTMCQIALATGCGKSFVVFSGAIAAAVTEVKRLFLDPDLAQPLHRMVWTYRARDEALPGLGCGACVRQLSRTDARRAG